MYSHLVAPQNSTAWGTTLSAVPKAPCTGKRAPPTHLATTQRYANPAPLYLDKCPAISPRRDGRARGSRSRVAPPAPIHVNTEPHFPVTNWAVGGGAQVQSTPGRGETWAGRRDLTHADVHTFCR